MRRIASYEEELHLDTSVAISGGILHSTVVKLSQIKSVPRARHAVNMPKSIPSRTSSLVDTVF